MIVLAQWRHDGPESSVLPIGLQTFDKVSSRRGKPGFDALLLYAAPTGSCSAPSRNAKPRRHSCLICWRTKCFSSSRPLRSASSNGGPTVDRCNDPGARGAGGATAHVSERRLFYGSTQRHCRHRTSEAPPLSAPSLTHFLAQFLHADRISIVIQCINYFQSDFFSGGTSASSIALLNERAASFKDVVL